MPPHAERASLLTVRLPAPPPLPLQDFLGALVVFAASLSTLIGALTAGLDPSMVGLAITYSLQVKQPPPLDQLLPALS